MSEILRMFLQCIVHRGTLDVTSASGKSFRLGDGSGKPVAVRFMDLAAERSLLFNPELAFGELYTDGRLVVTGGSVYDLLQILSANLGHQLPIAPTHQIGRRLVRWLHQWNSRDRSSRNVAHHYDLSERLYDLFLDHDRQYSCAYFEAPDRSLEEAQLAKQRHIAAKLLIEPGARLLDIGCGWGGLGLYIANHFDAEVTGITLSKEQLRVARQRVADAKMEAKADFLLQDYRDVRDSFDRIVSVGMFEHVGVGYYDAFFGKIGQLLTSDGVMVLHSIGRMDGPGSTNPWIDKYIFPGGYAPALSEVLPAIERAGLIVTDVEILRLHYAETLKHWRERFQSNRNVAASLYDERFCRMWEFYLAASETSFRHGGLMVFQIQLAKRQDAVPLTRDYIVAAETKLRADDAAQVRALTESAVGSPQTV